MAKVLGISRALVGHFETGARTISAEMAIAFESKLQLDVTRQALRPDLWSSQAA